MNEPVLKRILGKSIERELAEYDNENIPEHKFSLKHRVAMNRIFKRYEKNTRKTIELPALSAETMPHYGLKQKIIFVLVIVILMTLLTGWFIPLYRVTQEQIDWLRSRYDFSNMKINIPVEFTPGNNPDYAAVGVWRINDDYLDFLSDLEEMGIYTAEDVNKIDSEYYYMCCPIDTRPDSFKKEPLIVEDTIDYDSETPLSRAQYAVSYLEKRINYYTERSKDKARAVDGDAEFAADIRDNYLPFYKNHLKLIEKLYAERSDDESSENSNNALVDLDKDDRRYLFKINESEKC